MTRAALALWALLWPGLGLGAQGFDALLERVRAETAREAAELAEREAQFRARRDDQRRLLEEAKAALAAEERRGQDLSARFDANEALLAERRARLREEAGALIEVSEIMRQSSAEAAGVLRDSVLNAQHPQWYARLAALAKGADVAGIEAHRSLWLTVLEAMNAAGKATRFEAPVITAAGEEEARAVTRAGVFTAVSGGRFLRYLPETGKLMELARQPPADAQSTARAFEEATPGLAAMVIDPTRGALLALIVRTPDLRERIRQGGIVGYAIIGLAAVALLIALERLVVLGITRRRVRRQLSESQPRADNPLGRVMAAAGQSARIDAETLELRLDEAILKELPRVRRGLGTLGILAAVAPLLGLLGTVTGMIETFQSISLFGAGDPRLMSGGISQALVTTELGLVAAIPIMLAHSLLSGRSEALVQILDEQSAAAVARAAERDGSLA